MDRLNDDRAHSEITCAGRLEHVPALLAFVEKACRANRLSGENTFAFRLAAEEVVANIIKHGYSGGASRPIHLHFDIDHQRAALSISDNAPHFSPDTAPPPDLDSDWENRPLGGLGWHLVFQLMDEVLHEPILPVGNRVTLIKNLSPS